MHLLDSKELTSSSNLFDDRTYLRSYGFHLLNFIYGEKDPLHAVTKNHFKDVSSRSVSNCVDNANVGDVVVYSRMVIISITAYAIITALIMFTLTPIHYADKKSH